jgi:metallophosphoesterase (TIGR00282 family)
MLQNNLPKILRVLMLGDIVGSPGVNILQSYLLTIKKSMGLDLVIANAENAAGGSGLTPSIFKKLKAAGVDLFTLGDHIYKKQEIVNTLISENCICKPANYPSSSPGKTFAFTNTVDGFTVAVVSLMGRTFMRPVDCPFSAAEKIIPEVQMITNLIIVDIHAEATSDKYLMGHFLKGKVSAVLGTHTHVQTADEQILGEGTAFICDLGMTGPYDSVLGRCIEPVTATTISFLPNQFSVASGDVRMSGVVLEINAATGKTDSISRVQFCEKDLQEKFNGTEDKKLVLQPWP